MKRWSKVIALALVVAVLAAGYILLAGGNRSTTGTTGTQASASATPDPDKVKPFTMKKDDIVKVVVKTDKGDIVLTQTSKNVTTTTQNSDGTTSTATNAVKVWVTDRFNVDTTVMDDMLYAVENSTTKRLVEADPKDLALYGLDKPSEVTFYNAAGKSETIKVGNKTPTADSYYIIRNGDKAVYTLENYYASNFKLGELQLMSRDLYTRSDLKATDMSDLTFYKGNQEVFSASAVPSAKSLTGTVWRLSYPLEIDADYQNLSKFLTGISGLRAGAIIEAEPSDLKVYGLDNPKYTFKYTLDGKSYVLKIGNKEDSSDYYAMLDGMNAVFTIAASSLNYTEMPFIDIVEKLVYLPSIYDTSKLVIEIDGRTDVLEMDLRQAVQNTDSSASTASPTPTPAKQPDMYKFNGKSIEDSNVQSLFRSYYQGAIGIMGDKIDLKARPQGTPFARFAYTNKADGKVTVVSLIPTPDEYGYYLMKDDKYTGLIMRKSFLDDKDLGIRTFYKKFIEAFNGLK